MFASADQRWMTYVAERHLVADTPSVFVRNELIVIVPKSNPARIGKLSDLVRRGIKIVMAAEAVPAGKYTRDMLAKLEAGSKPESKA